MCQNELLGSQPKGPPTDKIIRIGMDTSKHVFQLHGVNAAEKPVLRKKMRRKEMVDFFTTCPPTLIAIEACGGSHHWARLLASFGHEVKMIARQLAKPYVKRNKNDAADAEGLCEAMSRPTMRFVPVKTVDEQAALMLISVRTRLIANRSQLATQSGATPMSLVSPQPRGWHISLYCWKGYKPTGLCQTSHRNCS
jgi:transposase